MKNLAIVFLIGMFCVACNSTGPKTNSADAGKAAIDTANYTTVQWIDSLKDVGQLKMGETATIDFTFKNTGSHPLFVISAEPGCGCTVADYPKQAIAPDGEGVITAAFDTKKGHEGEFRKNINVTTNTKGSTSHVLFFMGTIVTRNSADSSGNS